MTGPLITLAWNPELMGPKDDLEAMMAVRCVGVEVQVARLNVS